MKTSPIATRFEAADLVVIEKAAKTLGLSVAEFMRRATVATAYEHAGGTRVKHWLATSGLRKSRI